MKNICFVLYLYVLVPDGLVYSKKYTKKKKNNGNTTNYMVYNDTKNTNIIVAEHQYLYQKY